MFSTPFLTHRNTVFVAAVVLALGFLLSERAAADETATQIIDRLQQEAKAYLDQKNYAGAQDTYRQVLRDYPDVIESQCGLIRALILSHDTVVAKSETATLLSNYSSHPGFAKAAQEVADTFSSKKEYAEALRLYQAVVNNKPKSKDAMWSQRSIAKVLIQQGDFASAHAAAETLLSDYATRSDFAKAVRQVADTFSGEKEYAEAMLFYQAVVNNQPKAGDAIWSQRGIAKVLIQQGDFASAQAAADTLISDYATHSDFARAAHEVADAFSSEKEYAEALRLHQAVVDKQPKARDSIWSQRSIAKMLIQQGDFISAYAAADKLISDYATRPDFEKAAQQVADAFSSKKEYAEALRLYQAVVNNKPKSRDAMWSQRSIAKVLIEQRDFASAHAAAETLISEYATHSDFAKAVRQVADAFFDKKEYAEAMRLYQKVLELSRSKKEQNNAYAGIARVAILQGNEAAAQSMIDLILNNYTDPNDAAMALYIIGEGYYYQGMDYHKNNKSTQARESYQKAIAIWQNNVDQVVTSEYQCEGYYGLGLAYWQLGDWFPAADAFMRSIDADPNHQFAGSMHWLVSDCYEKLKRDGVVSAEEADPLIEWGYKTLFDLYPDSRDVEYAAIQLIKIHLARGEPVSACVYFNWFLDHTHAENGQMADIGQIMERMEGCSR